MAKRNINKKGTIQDLIIIVVVVFAFSVGMLLVFKVSNELNTKIQASEQFDTNAKTAFSKINSMYPGVMDNMSLLIAIGLSIVALVMASLVRVHPVFIAFYIIILGIIIFISAGFSNVYQTIAAESEFTALANQLIFTSNIMKTLPFIVAVVGGLLAIIMYKAWQTEVG